MKKGLFQIDIAAIGSPKYNLKREMILFEEVIICNDQALNVETYGHKYINQVLNYYRRLIKAGHVKTLDPKKVDPSILDSSGEAKFLLNEKLRLDEERREFWHKMKNRDKYKDFDPAEEYYENDEISSGLYGSDVVNRLISIFMNSINSEDEFIPIQKKYFPTSERTTEGKDKVINLALKEFPVIKNDVPIEQVIEFRNEKEMKLRYFELRDFITNLSKENLSHSEIQDKFEYLLHKYEEGLKQAKLKYTTSTLKTICIAGAEIIENLAKLKFSTAVKNLFELNKQNFELLEAEKNLKGREVSFIYYANQNFSNRRSS